MQISQQNLILATALALICAVLAIEARSAASHYGDLSHNANAYQQQQRGGPGASHRAHQMHSTAGSYQNQNHNHNQQQQQHQAQATNNHPYDQDDANDAASALNADETNSSTMDDDEDGEIVPLADGAQAKSGLSNFHRSAAASSSDSDAGSLEDADASELSLYGGAGANSPMGAASAANQAAANEYAQLDKRTQQWANTDIDNDNDPDEAEPASQDADGQMAAAASDNNSNEALGLGSNIANAKIEMSPRDMSTAAGHHYHGHGVHGMLKMGAETGKKGAFKWYDKHPVGGKGRR